MKETGILRKVDEVGRIVIPSELREHLDIDSRDALEIYTEDDKIILKMHQPSCAFCNEGEDIIPFRGKFICRDCLSSLSKLK